MTMVVLLAAAMACASTVLPLSFKQLSERARRVSVGRIERISSFQDPATGRITSRVEVNESQSIPEGSPGTFSFEMTGGTVGNLTQWIAGFPRLQPGDRVVLFLLEDTASPLGPTVGLWQGVFFLDSSDTVMNHRRQPVVELRGDQIVVQETGAPSGRVNVRDFLGRVSALRLPGNNARR